MTKKRDQLTARYHDVIKYKSLEWTLASFYRMSQITESIARAIKKIESSPHFIEKERSKHKEVIGMYDLIRDKAFKQLELAYAKAKELKVSNHWTLKIYESLHRHKPLEYPKLKEQKGVSVEEQHTPIKLDAPASDSAQRSRRAR